MMDFRDCEDSDGLCRIVPAMASMFKTLGDLTRLQIICLLATDKTGKLGVSVLAEKLNVSQPAISQHLKILKGEGIVGSRREGLHVFHYLNRNRMIELREYFELMYSRVMDSCDRELVLNTLQQSKLNACVIFYSYTGVTRGVAGHVMDACGCDLVEIKTIENYSTFTAYTKGVMRSRRESLDRIVPDEIDVSRYELLIIGTPVWAWKPAPAINAAVGALRGCEGKKAVIFVTSCGQPGEALPILKRALSSRGVDVVAEISLSKEEIEGQTAKNDLIWQILEAYPAGDADEQRLNENREMKK